MGAAEGHEVLELVAAAGLYVADVVDLQAAAALGGVGTEEDGLAAMVVALEDELSLGAPGAAVAIGEAGVVLAAGAARLAERGHPATVHTDWSRVPPK